MLKVFHCKSLLFLLLLVGPLWSSAQYTAERITTEELEVETGAEFKVENKYGDITISATDQKGITIKSLIKVKKKGKYEAEELLDRIKPEISNFGRYVGLKMIIEEKSAGFLNRLLADAIDFDKSDVEINLEILVPQGTELDIKNDFGDVVLSNWSGELRSEIRHGDLHVTDAIERANVDHSFGRVNFFEVKIAEVELSNGRLKAERIEDLRLDSNGSEIDVNHIGYLNITSNKDELKIENLDRIKGDIKFGNAFINELTEEIYLNLWISDVRVSKVNGKVPSIFINQRNSEVDINIAGLGFALEADMEGGIFRLPESMKGVESKVIDEKSNHRTVTANYGAVGEGKITLEGKKGFVIFREL